MLQALVLLFAPEQGSPPFWGFGESHFRVLDWVPPPHFLEHLLQADQPEKPPFTKRKREYLDEKIMQ